MNFRAPIAALYRETSASLYLAGKVKFGVLASLPLLNGTFDRQRNLHTHTLHVGLDFIC